ncbi:MAG: superoxide dismutase [Sediminibacterium sp.]|nr:MAG: superoxide dismutase [Sediminibacterium sp.]
MSKSTQNRRQFIATSSKAGMAIAAMPLMTKISPITSINSITTLTAAGEYAQQPLNYGYAALEPFIDAMTMEIHYTKHAAAYAKNLADATLAEKLDIQTTTLQDLLKNISHYSPKMRNNAGGHFNHEMFWQLMKPAPSITPAGELAEAINKGFGSLDNFKTAFSDAAKTRFGSGWAWLIVKADNSLAVCSTPNQDNPLMDIAETKGSPILGLDVWEHAYYLKYQNKRPDYINAWWNLVNWEFAQKKYAESLIKK